MNEKENDMNEGKHQMTEKPNAARMRSYVSNFHIYMGDMVTAGRLVPVEAAEPKGRGAGSYHYCTPTGDTVKQVYRDHEGTIYETSELAFYMEDEDGERHIVDKAAVDEARKSELEANSMHLTIHDLREMDGQVWPNGTKKSFVFVPDSSKESNVVIERALIRAVSLNKFGFLAVVNLRNHEGVFRLVEWRGHLVVQPQVYTDALKPHEPHEPFRLAKEATEKIETLCDMLSTPFDASDYINDTKRRVKAAEAIALGRAEGAKIVERTSKTVDLMSILDSAISGKRVS